MSAIITGLIGAVVQEAGDRFRISKTKVLAHGMGLNTFVALLPRVLEKDPEAIGSMVLLVATWIGILFARGNKG